MKKLVFVLALALISAGCEGRRGPVGPEGPQGPEGGTNYTTRVTQGVVYLIDYVPADDPNGWFGYLALWDPYVTENAGVIVSVRPSANVAWYSVPDFRYFEGTVRVYDPNHALLDYEWRIITVTEY